MWTSQGTNILAKWRCTNMIGINSIWICFMESIWTCSMEWMWTCPWNPYGLVPWNGCGLVHEIHMDLFHGMDVDLSMESMVDMPTFHMESTWHSDGFHMEFMMFMEQWIGCGPGQHWFHGFHMDSIWINPGKVKTSPTSQLSTSNWPSKCSKKIGCTALCLNTPQEMNWN